VSTVAPSPVPASTSTEWWRDAVIYQIYPRSFADGNGDGIGDLPGITSRLEHIRDLGVDAIWLSPFYVSPQHDGGYDVADFRDVDPLFGKLSDADDLLARAHELGLRVIVDMVPNHTSSEHVWFQEARVAPADSPARHRYIFRDGRGMDGSEPPNNWTSIFGGPAWTRETRPDGTPGQWYLHLFDTTQPDLNWSHPDVQGEFDDILRFWLDRGVDGFRVDVAHGLIKEEGLPDHFPSAGGGSMGGDEFHATPYFGQEGVHDVWRRWRALLESYGHDRVLVAEAWIYPLSRMARWVRSDEMHQAFNFPYLETPWDAREQRKMIDESLDAFAEVGAPSTWVLSNHDVVRHASRLALSAENPQGHGIGPDSPGLPIPDLGLKRARAATLMMLALPGSAYIYQGEELGLPEHVFIPDEARQDPTWFRTNHERYGRDGCRVPLPWEAKGPAYGFNASGATWLPQPDAWAGLARDVQSGDPSSTLELYRTAIRLRGEHGLGSGSIEWLELGTGVLAFDNGGVRVIANISGAPVTIDGEVLAASGPVADTVPKDTTVWLSRR
jgi:alpha-glucosidase